MNILILSGSPRKGGNTDLLVEAFVKGAVIDRCHNPVRDSFPIKKMALLLVGAATLPELFDSILAQYQLCLNFFKLEDAGRVLVRGVKDKGDIKNTNALNEAFELGQSI